MNLLLAIEHAEEESKACSGTQGGLYHQRVSEWLRELQKHRALVEYYQNNPCCMGAADRLKRVMKEVGLVDLPTE